MKWNRPKFVRIKNNYIFPVEFPILISVTIHINKEKKHTWMSKLPELKEKNTEI